jgi:oxygen-independent coproporphyrinogen-3 oxidase
VKIGLYVHAPFCVHKCGYCDFNSWAETRREPMVLWLDALKKQAVYWGPRLRDAGIEVDTIFYGGGTPSLLPNDVIEASGVAIQEFFPRAAGLEWSVECNPETLDAAKLAALRACGANRLSVGIQSFENRFLDRLERRARREHNLAALELVSGSWKGSWSCDLMFGLPTQTLEEWERDLTTALSFRPPHLSAYQLTLTTERSKNWQQAGEEGLLAFFDLTRKLTEAAGLRAYEVSNFARPGEECRHNLHYWRLDPFLGLGPGAAGLLPPRLVPAGYGAHQKNPDRFEAWTGGAGSETETRWLQKRNSKDHLFEMLMMGLRLEDGLDESRFGPWAGLFEQSVRTLPDPSVFERIQGVSGNAWKASPAGLRLLDTHLSKLFENLEKNAKAQGLNLDSEAFDPKFT